MADWKDALIAKTEDTTPDIDADMLLSYDDSAGILKKTKPASILGTALVALRSLFTPADASGPASLQLHEDTDNGTNKVTISAPSSLASDRAWVFPDAAGTFASQAYVDASVVGLLEDKGNTDCSGNPNYPAASKGDVYTVSVAGKIGGASGVTVEVGDWFRAIADNAGGTQAGVGSSWAVVQANLVGAITTAGGTFTGDIEVPDEAYDATGWNGSVEVPTKNAVRDKIEALITALGVDDTAYDATSWNGVTATAPSKNAVRDQFEAEPAAARTLSAKKISLTPAHGSDDTYEGLQIPGLNNSGGVTQWDPVYLNSSSQWVVADANGSGTYPARGLAVSTESTGNPVTVLTYGTVRNDAWTWTPGGTIYLSTAAGLTQTAPSTSGDKVQAVGYAITADIAFFDFNSTYLTVT